MLFLSPPPSLIFYFLFLIVDAQEKGLIKQTITYNSKAPIIIVEDPTTMEVTVTDPANHSAMFKIVAEKGRKFSGWSDDFRAEAICLSVKKDYTILWDHSYLLKDIPVVMKYCNMIMVLLPKKTLPSWMGGVEWMEARGLFGSTYLNQWLTTVTYDDLFTVIALILSTQVLD